MRHLTALLCLGFASQTSATQHKKGQETGIQELGQQLTQSFMTSEQQQEQLGQILSDKLVSDVKKLAETAGQGATIQVPDHITHTILIKPQTVNLLPGVYHLSKGFNAFKGVPFFEGGQSNKDVFTFTFNEEKGTSGDKGYLVPDQMDIPPLSYQCQYSDRATEVTIGSSTEFMKAYENSVSHEASASASGGFGGASFSVEASYKNANSSARQSSQTARSEGKERQMSTSAIATLYTFALKEGTEQTFLSKDFEDDVKNLKGWAAYVKLISTYGTHYLKTAKMGARFQENIYFSSEATSEEISSAKSQANSNSISASVSGGYGAFSGSASYQRDAASASSGSNSSSNSREESTSRGGMRQFGQIDASGKCGDLLGDENILFPVEYETEPLYKLIDPKKYPRQRRNLQHLLKVLIQQGARCAKEQCTDQGTCVVDQFYFDKPYQGFDYTKIFKDGECVCNQDRMGHDCSEKLDLAQLKEDSQKNAKKIVWTTMNRSDQSLMHFQINGHDNQSVWIQSMTKDAEFAVFSSGAYHSTFKQTVARYGNRIIAVNKKEALDAKVIAKPETYQIIPNSHFQIRKPICPKGFSTVSEHLYFNWNRPQEQMKYFNEGTVQCIRDEYIISEGSARQKYGFTKVRNVLVIHTAGGRMSHSMVLSTPEVYKHKDAFSSFDLGLTGQVYYPPVVLNSRKADKFIDFGHPDFFFTEEPRQTMADMLKK